MSANNEINGHSSDKINKYSLIDGRILIISEDRRMINVASTHIGQFATIYISDTNHVHSKLLKPLKLLLACDGFDRTMFLTLI
jgi:hypothetical protein